MEATLIQVGLPVKCQKCKAKDFVKPATDYGGWYKSRMFKGWYCPEHAKAGGEAEKKFYDRYKTPEPVPEDTTQDELYKLLD